MSHLRLQMSLGLAGLALFAFGCDAHVETIYVDPIVDFGDAEDYVPSGKPTVDLGFYVEQLYLPLDDGDECPVVHGLQGGTWSMPALRSLGIDMKTDVLCTIITEADEQVGKAETNETFVLATDGWLEVQAMPIRVRHAAPNKQAPIDDLYGQTATLSCTVTDDEGRSDTVAREIVLSEG